MKKIKILLITQLLVNDKMRLFKLLDQNYDITYLITRKTEEHTKTINDIDKIKYKHFKPYNFLRGVFSPSILKEILFSDYDVVINQDPHTPEAILSSIISRLRRKKSIIYSETWNWPRHPSVKILAPFLWIMFKLTDSLISTSHKAVRFSQKLGYPKSKKFFIAHLPSDDYYNSQNKVPLPESLYDLKNKKVLLYLNRIVPYKGLDLLLKAIENLNRDDIHLIICGTDYKDKKTRNTHFIKNIMEKIDSMNNVSYVGYSEEKKSFYLNLADLVVFPTTTRDYDGESWGVTTVEAMSAAKPVLVTDAVGCAEEVVNHGQNGLIIQHNNVTLLTTSLNNLLADKEILRQMGKSSRKIWKTITWENYFNSYKKAIEYSFSKI